VPIVATAAYWLLYTHFLIVREWLNDNITWRIIVKSQSGSISIHLSKTNESREVSWKKLNAA
jgi:hypothetical protein